MKIEIKLAKTETGSGIGQRMFNFLERIGKTPLKWNEVSMAGADGVAHYITAETSELPCPASVIDMDAFLRGDPSPGNLLNSPEYWLGAVAMLATRHDDPRDSQGNVRELTEVEQQDLQKKRAEAFQCLQRNMRRMAMHFQRSLARK